MSQFTINGITFEDDKDSLQHGLGVGGGRGRPKGSRNGYINPNAAYMKNYQVVGEVADYSDPLNTGKRPANPPRERTWAPSPQSPGPTRRITTKEAQKRLIDSFRKQGDYKAAQRPADSVQSGKTLMEKVLKEQTLPEQNIQEQYLTETKPAETQTEKPSQERTQEILNWVQNDPDADKKIREYLANNPKYQSGIDNYQPPQLNLKRPPDATTQTIIDAGDFLRDNVLNPAEQWAGDRGRDLDRWWNGYDVAPTGSPKDRERRQAGETDHVSGARERIEESLSGAGDTAKDWWNGLLDWGKDAWNDISGAATSAIDTGKGWAKSGLDWVNKNILDPAGDWGSRALSDIGGWIGDRAGDLDRWWNGYQEEGTNVHGSPEKRAQRQAGHVPGFRENAGAWVNNAANDVGGWFNDRGQDLDRWWNGYQEEGTNTYGSPADRANRQAGHVPGFRENAGTWVNNAVNDVGEWFNDRGQDLNRFINGYQQEGTNTYGSPSDRANRQAGHVNGLLDNIADLPQNVSNFVQREIVNPVTGAVETYLIDPVSNAVVAVGNAVRDYVVNPARGAAQQINQNIVQPAATALNDYVVQPASAAASSAADAAGRAAEATGNAAANEYQYLQGSGDSYSDFARRGNVPSSVVDGINRSAASNGRSYQENLETRAELMQMLGTLSRNGMLSGNEIQRMYSNSQNSPDVLNSLYNEVLNAYMNATPRNSIRNSDR